LDILIVGAGLVGQVLALGLDQLGYEVGLVESKNFEPPSCLKDTRAIALSYGSVKILENLNLWEKLSAQATPINLVHVSEKGGFANCRIDQKELGLDYLGQVLEISVLLKNMMDLVSARKNIKLFAPAEIDLDSLEDFKNTKIMSLKSGEKIQAELIISADGRDSGIKKYLDLDSQTQSFNQVALVGNIKLKNSHENIAYERFTGAGPLALLPIDQDRATFIWVIRPEDVKKNLELAPEDFLRKLQNNFGYRAGKFQKLLSLQSHELIQTISQETYKNKILLMGNAAHALHPIAAQGFNLSLRDIAEFLNQVGKLGLESDQAVLNYLSMRTRDQKKVAQFSGFLAEIFTKEGFGLLKIARGLGLFFLEREKFSKRYLAERLAGVL